MDGDVEVLGGGEGARSDAESTEMFDSSKSGMDDLTKSKDLLSTLISL